MSWVRTWAEKSTGSSWPLMPGEPPALCQARMDWEPVRWAVVGGSGFIGRGIVQQLRDLKVDVRAVRAPRLHLDPGIFEGRAVASHAEFLLETNDLSVQLRGVDVVVNAAGLATPDAAASSALYGANSLLPAVVALSALRAGVGRVVHLSSAAVQGDRAVLDSSQEVRPFSPYSHSKAVGEQSVFAASILGVGGGRTDILVIRATSVQGEGRRTTVSLRRFASSPLASVAAPGNYPSVVSSLSGLVEFIHKVGVSKECMPSLLLQPWEGLNVRDVLVMAGQREPVVLPRSICRMVLQVGKTAGRLVPKVAGATRRLELLWFGQAQEASAQELVGMHGKSAIASALQGGCTPR